MKKNNYVIYAIILFIVSAFINVQAARAQSDFSGTWKLDTSASEFGGIPAAQGAIRQLTIAQDKQKIKVEKLMVNPEGKEYSFSETLGFDGTVVENTVPYTSPRKISKAASVKTTEDGKGLVLSSKYNVEEENQSKWVFTTIELCSLSADGRTLTIAKTSIIPDRTVKIKAVYRKQ